MEALLKGSDTPYNLQFSYDDSLFLKDAEVYDKDLSLLSFGAAISGTYEEWVTNFLSDCEFSDPKLHQMDIEPTEDTLGYALGHKTLDESELFTVIIRGHEYKKEWANNFIIGETGDHQGWLNRSNELYLELSNYVNQYKGEKAIKLWVVGYSRAGAISNMLASIIFRGNGFSVGAKDMYVYTFEAPAGLTQEHAVEYANVHNIVNSADIVTYIPPTQYDLHRAGKDFEIYVEDFETYVYQFDGSISIPSWTTCDPASFNGQQIRNEEDLTKYLINNIFANKNNDAISAHTRALYVQNYQTGLSYTIGMLLALDSNTRSSAMSSIQNHLFEIYLDPTGKKLADTLKPFLDQDGVSYNYTELVAACAIFMKAFNNLFSNLVTLYSSYGNNLRRVLDMHYPEVTYCLLKNANATLA